LNAALDALKVRFRERAAADAVTIEAAMAGGENGVDGLEPLIHGLAGAAGIFGHAAISEAALALDARFAEGRRPSPDELAALVETIRADLACYS
jgi:HPt (histidine-containing phosphotransfer) domain-containing protein